MVSLSMPRQVDLKRLRVPLRGYHNDQPFIFLAILAFHNDAQF